MEVRIPVVIPEVKPPRRKVVPLRRELTGRRPPQRIVIPFEIRIRGMIVVGGGESA